MKKIYSSPRVMVIECSPLINSASIEPRSRKVRFGGADQYAEEDEEIL